MKFGLSQFHSFACGSIHTRSVIVTKIDHEWSGGAHIASALTVNFHLIVLAAQVRDATISIEPRQVASPVDAARLRCRAVIWEPAYVLHKGARSLCLVIELMSRQSVA